MADKKLRFDSLAIHGGQKPDPSTGAVMTPIYQTSTFAQEAPGRHKGFEYARGANPTRLALEQSIASLEGVNHGLAFGSGMAATDAVLKLLKPGDEIISSHDLYGGTYRLFTKIFEDYGIKFHFMSLQDIEAVETKISEGTRMIWLESPSNPLLSIVDLKALSSVAKKHQAYLVVDNTFASPYLQQAASLGADIVMHSATKYLAGHSDVVLGLLAIKEKALFDQLKFIQNTSGAICGPMDAFLTLRGIKTLGLRMRQHCANAKQVAQFLESHPKVEKVYWPGLKDHPNHSIAAEQMRDFGGMLSFRLKEDNREAASQFLSSLRLITLAESLGGVESLCGHPVTMTHGSVPEAERLALGISEGLIRLSVGIEDAQDIIEDLEQALA